MLNMSHGLLLLILTIIYFCPRMGDWAHITSPDARTWAFIHSLYSENPGNHLIWEATEELRMSVLMKERTGMKTSYWWRFHLNKIRCSHSNKSWKTFSCCLERSSLSSSLHSSFFSQFLLILCFRYTSLQEAFPTLCTIPRLS